MSRDIIIPVMGSSGAGKSTFINCAVGKEVANVGHGLKPGTRNLQSVIVPFPGHPNRRIVFLDTPGFDNEGREDDDIVKDIGEWLKTSPAAKLAGIIYLCDISQPRIKSQKQLEMFHVFYAPNTVKNVILATTKWGQVAPVAAGQQRAREISEQHWKGLDMVPFQDTHASAWTIVDYVLSKSPDDALPIREGFAKYSRRTLPKKLMKSGNSWGFFRRLFNL